MHMRWREKAYRALTRRTIFPYAVSPGTGYGVKGMDGLSDR